ncbi:MAG: YfhO family protein [bacterium]
MNEPREVSPQRGRRSRWEYTPPVALVLFFCVFFSPQLLGLKFLSGGDIINHYLPYKAIALECLEHREWPLWNRYEFCGRPLLADIQLGLFYPPNWLFLALSLRWMFGFLAALHTILAALGMYFLLRRHVRHGGAAFIGALSFAAGGYFATRLLGGLVYFMWAAAWTPWCLLAWENWMAKRSSRSLASLALVLALQFLVGAPQVSFYTMFFVGLYSLFFLKRKGASGKSPVRHNLVVLGGLASAFVLCGLIVAAQFLPSKAYIAQSFNRASGAEWEYITNDSLRPRMLIMSVCPRFFYDPKDEGLFWGSSVGYWESNFYPGAMMFVLAVLGLGALRRKREGIEETSPTRRLALFCVVAIALGLALGFGDISPLFKFFYYAVPGFNRFRVPARTVLFVSVGLSVLGALGADRLLGIVEREKEESSEVPNRKKEEWIAAGAVLVGLVVLALIVLLNLPRTLQSLGIPSFSPINAATTPDDLAAQLRAAARGSLLRLIGFLIVPTLLIALALKMRKSARWLAVGLGAVLIVDLFGFGFPLVTSAKPAEFEETIYKNSEAVRFLKENLKAGERMTWMENVFDWHVDQNQLELYPNRNLIHGLAEARGYDPVITRGYVGYANVMAGLPPAENTGAFFHWANISVRPLLDLLNVRYVLSYAPLSEKDGFREARRFDFGLVIYENLRAAGTAFFRKAIPLPGMDLEELQAALASPKFDPGNLVFIETPNVPRPSPEVPTTPTARLVARKNNEIVLGTQGAGGLLVVSEIYDTGWRAQVDGVEAPVLRVDGALLGVGVGPGDHRVVMRYRPEGLVKGLVLTILGLVIVAIMFVAGGWTSRRAEKENAR